MRIRATIAAVILATSAGAATLAGGTAHAATVTCRSTTSHTYSVSSRGTVSDRWTTKIACGTGTYDEWEHGWTHSYTGASSTFHLFKDDDNGCWYQQRWTHSVSARGTQSNRYSYTVGGTC